jgi:hypothetical protein
MALGKAFIEVHADTKPFARELGRDLIRILEAAEKDVRKLARQTGQTIATETGKGIEKNSKKIGNSLGKALGDSTKDQGGIFQRFAKGIVDSIDDGLSGLPAEVKIALGAALAAMLPLIGASISGLVNATVVAAFAGLGFLIASQFEVVQTAWDDLLSTLSGQFFTNAGVFVEPVLAAFEIIETRLAGMNDYIREIFATAATFIEPVTNAFLSLIEGLLPGLLETLRNVGGVIAYLETDLYGLGRAIGNALAIISGSDYANEGFRDLLFIIGSLILGTAAFIRALTEIYGRLRQIALVLSGPEGVAQLLTEIAIDEQAKGAASAASANGLWADSFYKLASATEAHEAAMKDLNNQLAAYERMVLAQVDNEIAWEQAIDDFTKSVQENGRSLKLSEQAGRNNANALLALARAALQTRTDQINMGVEVGVAQKRFDEQKAAIYNLAAQMKLSKADTEKLIGALLNIPPPAPTGVDAASITRMQRLLALIQQIYSAPGFGAIFGAAFAASKNARTPAYANGGIITSPHMGLVGEAGPEAIIPLNKPARAAQLLNQSGLSGMMAPTVNVYIGNRQLDPYIDSRTDARNTSTARSLAYGSRGI